LFGGWYDEFDNYYGSDGLPCTPPNSDCEYEDYDYDEYENYGIDD